MPRPARGRSRSMLTATMRPAGASSRRIRDCSVPTVSTMTSKRPSPESGVARWSSASSAPRPRTKSRFFPPARATTCAPEEPADLDGDAADAPAAAAHQEPLTGLEGSLVAQGGHAVVPPASSETACSGVRFSGAGAIWRALTARGSAMLPVLRPSSPHTRSPHAPRRPRTRPRSPLPAKSMPLALGKARPVTRRTFPVRSEQVAAVDTGGAHPHQHLLGADDGYGPPADVEDVRGAETVEEDRVHLAHVLSHIAFGERGHRSHPLLRSYWARKWTTSSTSSEVRNMPDQTSHKPPSTPPECPGGSGSARRRPPQPRTRPGGRPRDVRGPGRRRPHERRRPPSRRRRRHPLPALPDPLRARHRRLHRTALAVRVRSRRGPRRPRPGARPVHAPRGRCAPRW